MTLFEFALHNVRQRPARSLLTVMAVALGVAAAVALTGIAWGFEASWQKANDARGTDLIVTRLASTNAMPSPFRAEPLQSELRGYPKVRDVVGLLSEMLSVDTGAPPVFVFGWTHGSYLWQHLKLIDGRWPANNDEPAVAIGVVTAELLHKKTGDVLEIEGRRMPVVGVFESPAAIENGAVLMTLGQAQQTTDKPGKVNVLNVKLDADTTPADIDAIKLRIRERVPGFIAITSGELVGQNTVVRIAKAMSNATTLIAGLVGVLIVFNTMLMSVNERTREIGVLLALGWHRRTVVQLVCSEAALLTLAGGIAGVLVGVALTWQLEHLDLLRGKIDANFPVGFLLAMPVLAMLVGVLGGFYPAMKASRLTPSHALRQE
jgi:putative ABC transport system permease protein